MLTRVVNAMMMMMMIPMRDARETSVPDKKMRPSPQNIRQDSECSLLFLPIGTVPSARSLPCIG